MEDFLVTIKLRVRVTDANALLDTVRGRDPDLLAALGDDPELTLSLAVQEAVKPPVVRGVAGLSSPDTGPVASVKVEPWPTTGNPW